MLCCSVLSICLLSLPLLLPPVLISLIPFPFRGRRGRSSALPPSFEIMEAVCVCCSPFSLFRRNLLFIFW